MALAVLDEVASLHPPLHARVFRLLCRLMGRCRGDLDRSRMLVDRLVHLLWHGCVIPVLDFLDQLRFAIPSSSLSPFTLLGI